MKTRISCSGLRLLPWILGGSCLLAAGAISPQPTTERSAATAAFNLGHQANAAGRAAEAQERWQEALTIYQKLPGTEREQADCQLNLGLALWNLAQYDAAMGHYEQALKKYQEIKGTERQQGDCQLNLGLVLWRRAQYEPAMGRYEQALKMYQEIKGTERQQADCHLNLGLALRSLARYEAATARYEQALKIYQEIKGTERQQADCLVNLGMADWSVGHYETALTRSEQALKLYQEIKGTEREQANCQVGIGVALWKMDQPEAAMARFERALNVYQEITGAGRQQADCLVNMGAVFWSVGQPESGLARYERALQMYQEIAGTEREQAGCQVGIGLALCRMGRLEPGMARAEQALKVYQAIKGTERDQADCQVGIGVALWRIGQHEAAMARTEQALKLYQEIQGTEREQAGCHVNISTVLWSMGQYEAAIARSEHALQIYQKIKGTERLQADCLVGIGGAFWRMDQHDAGMTRSEHALKLYQEIKGAEREQAGCQLSIGAALGRLGQHEAAMARFEQALKLYQEIKGTEREQANCHFSVAGVLFDMRQYAAAMVRQEQALKMFQMIKGSEADQGACQAGIAYSLLHLGEAGQALARFELARHLMRSGWTCRGQGLAFRRRGQAGDSLKALDALIQAASQAEEERARRCAVENQAGLAKDVSAAFRDLVELLVDLHHRQAGFEPVRLPENSLNPGFSQTWLEAAVHYLERGKGGALEETLREGVGFRATRADTKVLAEDRQLCRRIAKLASFRDSLDEVKLAEKKSLTEEIDRLEQRRSQIDFELTRSAVGGYVAPTYRKAMELAQELEPTTAALEYSVGEEEIWLLLLTRQGISVHRVEVPPRALPELLPRQEATLRQLADAWKRRPNQVGLDGLVRLARARAEGQGEEGKSNLISPEQEQSILARLGALVLPSTARAELQEKRIRHLLVIPDGSLHHLPLAMLRVGGEKGHCLIEDYSISYLPALTTLKTIRSQKAERERNRQGPRGGLLAFAHPGIGSETPLAAELEGDLQARAVMELALDADVVFLSAGESRLGRRQTGEGWVGLSGAFFFAGAESVCASLWRTPSTATAELASEFFRNLRTGKMSRAEALRQAQLTMLRKGQNARGPRTVDANPTAWAAFELMGEYYGTFVEEQSADRGTPKLEVTSPRPERAENVRAERTAATHAVSTPSAEKPRPVKPSLSASQRQRLDDLLKAYIDGAIGLDKYNLERSKLLAE